MLCGACPEGGMYSRSGVDQRHAHLFPLSTHPRGGAAHLISGSVGDSCLNVFPAAPMYRHPGGHLI